MAQDTLPLGLDFSSATVSQGSVTNGGTLSWNVGDLAPNATATLELSVVVDPSLDGQTNVSSTAFVYTSLDPTTVLSSSSVAISVQAAQSTSPAVVSSTDDLGVISLSDALQLDANQNTIADIFDLVNAQDQNYADLTNGQFARITFQDVLDNTRDITVYATPGDDSGDSSVLAYPVYADSQGNLTDGSPILATFEVNQYGDGEYVIPLSNLQTSTAMFDLQIEGNVDIDYIVDPVTRYWVGDGANGDWSNTANWSATSGGSPGASVPASSTDVFFNLNSTSSIIDIPFTIGSLTINGYTGTITQEAPLTITSAAGNSGSYTQTSAATFITTTPATNTFRPLVIFPLRPAYLGATPGPEPRVIHTSSMTSMASREWRPAFRILTH